MKMTAEEIDAKRSKAGGWTKETLAGWGISWPPPFGWRQALIKGELDNPVAGVMETIREPSAFDLLTAKVELLEAQVRYMQQKLLEAGITREGP